MFAEEALLQMADEGFWLMTARQDGVTDLAMVKGAHRQAVQDLDRELSTANLRF